MLDKLAHANRGDQDKAPRLQIRPELNLDYPQSDIKEISRDDETGSYKITTTFFGLYGVSSPLPGFYTEELLDDEWDEYRSRKDFFDVIHNHIYPLLYEAWLKYKFSHKAVEFADPKYCEIIFSLIGLNQPYRSDRENYGYLLKYSGLLGQRIRSLLGLKTMLQDCLGELGLDIKPCQQRRVPIVKKQRCVLGEQNAVLGKEACIGKEVIDRSGKFSIEIGPLSVEQYAAIEQGRTVVAMIKTLLKIYLVQPLEFNISLLLEPGALVPSSLGDGTSSVLGNNCWLINQPNKANARIELIESVA